MASNINLIAFGTFGNPNGFRQTFFVGQKELARSVKSFDLNTNAIKLFINAKVFAIRKEYVNGFNAVAYSIYSFAKEQNSDRSGTFIGSTILFTNKIAEEQISVNLLNKFHKHLIDNNVLNDIITVNHSDNLTVKKPVDFDKIDLQLRQVENLDFSQTSNKILAVYCNTSDEHLSKFFKKSIDLLNIYDTIYFTENKDVAEFVHQKGIFKLIQNFGDKKEFEKEIENLIEERKRKRDLSISEFEREFQRLEEDKSKTIDDFKLQIEKNEKQHQDNELIIKESKKDLEFISQLYIDFTSKTKELVNQLRSGSKMEETKQVHNENKLLFKDGINKLQKPVYINKLQKLKAKSDLRVEQRSQELEPLKHRERIVNTNKKEYSIDIYKVLTIILSITLLFTLKYSSFFDTNEVSSPAQISEKKINSQPEPAKLDSQVTPNIIKELNPKPNLLLNKNDFRLVAKQLKYKSNIETVVKTIFDANPEDIKKHYIGQEKIYAKNLILLNKECFKEEKDGDFIFFKDTIKEIPYYKKKL